MHMKKLWPLLFLLLVAMPLLAEGEFYQYIDENGTVSFTDNLGNIPPEQRKAVLGRRDKQTTSQNLQGDRRERPEEGVESLENCGEELNNTIENCKQLLENERTLGDKLKTLGPFDIVSMYTMCSLSPVQNRLTAQEKGLLAQMAAEVESAQKKLTQKEKHLIDFGVGMMIARCKEKKTYSEKEIEDMDVRFRSIWKEMSEALGQNKVEKAVSYYAEQSRALWRKQFNTLGPEVMAKISHENLEAQIHMDYVRGSRAVYELITTRDGTQYSFQLIFEKNSQGEWKIFSY